LPRHPPDDCMVSKLQSCINKVSPQGGCLFCRCYEEEKVMPVIACDVSKATLDAAWLNESGQCWFERSKIANSRRGWQEMLRWLEKSSGKGRREFTLVVEATGVYHRPLIDFAVAEGLRVIVTNPGRAAENARSHNRLNKNDRLDARGLYGYGKELKKVHEYVPDSQEISVLKALLSRLRQLDKDLLRER